MVGAEQDLVAAKHRDTQLGFALLLKFYGRFGRFPRGRAELHEDVVEFVARQLGVQAGSLGFYEWAGRTIKRPRAEIRADLGFRECTVVDAEKLTDWLAGGYAQKERRFELAKDAVLAELRARAGNRSNARNTCHSTSQPISWRNHEDVDVIGEIDTGDTPFREAVVNCVVN